ncbi:hypothetical protein HYX13_01755 [Candidatus Woesearchaeota archaeon]|nr:hypothetical protein [Candidatus Woesearchaeota archaeon]
MNLIQEAFQRLFPEEIFPYRAEIEYNRRLSTFNANIRLHHNTISLHLNLQWKDIDNEIKIGLIQNLLIKILKGKRLPQTESTKNFNNSKAILHTPNIELYTNFIKNIPMFAEKNKTDPLLDASFQRVNQHFFSGVMEKPNLQWGTDSRRKLAHYNFHDDSVTVSTLFQQGRTEVLDYLMYHELLHKHHQFNHKNGRGSYHGREFRRDEDKYPQRTFIDEEIKRMTRRKRGFFNFL